MQKSGRGENTLKSDEDASRKGEMWTCSNRVRVRVPERENSENPGKSCLLLLSKTNQPLPCAHAFIDQRNDNNYALVI